MERRDCDAIVLFGATGDLCYRKIFPALYQLVRRGLLNIPVIGVALLVIGCGLLMIRATTVRSTHDSYLRSILHTALGNVASLTGSPKSS